MLVAECNNAQHFVDNNNKLLCLKYMAGRWIAFYRCRINRAKERQKLLVRSRVTIAPNTLLIYTFNLTLASEKLGANTIEKKGETEKNFSTVRQKDPLSRLAHINPILS